MVYISRLILVKHTQTLEAAIMKVLVVLFFSSLLSTAFASSVRSSGSCLFSNTPAEVQRCEDGSFFCPVDSECKARSLRCMTDSVCVNGLSEENCYESDSSYDIYIGRSSLISKKKQLELNHQFVDYRGFTYEFGCGYGVQILDLNDPNYKYKNKEVTYTQSGVSECTYDETLPFTKQWSLKYNILTNNCQHFAREFSKYLKNAQCGSRKRQSTNLDEYAEEVIDECTDCCESESESESSSLLVSATYTSVIMLILHNIIV